MKPRCAGKFGIGANLIDENPGLVSAILSTVIVVRAEMIYANNVIEYIGVSPLFAEVPYGEMIPWYKCKVDNEKATIIGWERI